MKLPNQYTGKKNPTNPIKKQQHEARTIKKVLLNSLQDEEWKQQVREYATTKI